MNTWRERLCGSEIEPMGEEDGEAVWQFLNPSETMTCGGGFFPSAQSNSANLSTYGNNVMLPTKQYSVLIFKDDGSAVIYSDEEPTSSAEDADGAVPGKWQNSDM